MDAIWERVLTPGYGRAINRPTRIAVRSQAVVVLGPVAFEPSLVRVRLADGSVVRVQRDELKPLNL